MTIKIDSITNARTLRGLDAAVVEAVDEYGIEIDPADSYAVNARWLRNPRCTAGADKYARESLAQLLDAADEREAELRAWCRASLVWGGDIDSPIAKTLRDLDSEYRWDVTVTEVTVDPGRGMVRCRLDNGDGSHRYAGDCDAVDALLRLFPDGARIRAVRLTNPSIDRIYRCWEVLTNTGETS